MLLPDTLSRNPMSHTPERAEVTLMSAPTIQVVINADSAPATTAAVPHPSATGTELRVPHPSVLPAADTPPSTTTAGLPAPSPVSAADPLLSTTIAGLPANTHPIVHTFIYEQQHMSAGARAEILRRAHAYEKRLGDVQALYIAGRLYIPAGSSDIHRYYLNAVHCIAHASDIDMVVRLRNRVKVCWDSMAADAARFYASCGQCQHGAAGSRPMPVGRMSPFLYPHPNRTYFVDFFGPLPPCKRASPLDPTGAVHEYLYLVSLVDGNSRFALYLRSTHKSAAVAAYQYNTWCAICGPPERVRTAAVVVTVPWQTYCKSLAAMSSLSGSPSLHC